MIIQSISNPSLSPLSKKKINFCSTTTKQNDISKSMDSSKNNEDNKQKLKKTYWKGVISGILFSVLVIGGDRLCEYLIKKNSPKLK